MARFDSRLNARTILLATAFTTLALLAGCGGGADSSAPAGVVSQGPPSDPVIPVTPAIEGVATPDAVAVVTATNVG